MIFVLCTVALFLMIAFGLGVWAGICIAEDGK